MAVSSRTFLALTALALVAGVVAVACGGGDSGDRPNARKIPTATAYAILPEPTILSGGVPVTGGGGGDTYVVKAGDSLASIAAELGVPMEELISLNNLEDPSRLEVDQVLKIPPRGGASATPGPGTQPTQQATPGESAAGTEEYEVQSGDNASDIAARFGITLDELAEANGMSVDDLRTLFVGQILTIPQFPGRTPEPTIPEPEVTEEPIEVPTEEPTEAPPEETPILEELTPTPFEDIGGGVETATPEGGG
jgi:LysM repeat protein